MRLSRVQIIEIQKHFRCRLPAIWRRKKGAKEEITITLCNRGSPERAHSDLRISDLSSL